MSHSMNRSFIALTVVAGLFLSTGCQQNDTPATFSITVPQPNTLETSITLTKHYGINLTGNFPILQYGSIFLNGEAPDHGFNFGFTLNTAAFLQQSWVNYQEVSTLPTGDAFPSWQTGPVVDVIIPPANTNAVDWHFYFGTHGQFYMGVASVIHGIDANFPAVRLEYSFYDNQGRVIIGLVFFGPKVTNGHLDSPGGIFVGTNITPFLPADVLRANAQNVTVSSSSSSLPSASVAELVRSAGSGRPVRINGQSVVADLKLSGPDAHKYRTRSQVQGVIDRFMAVSNTR